MEMFVSGLEVYISQIVRDFIVHLLEISRSMGSWPMLGNGGDSGS